MQTVKQLFDALLNLVYPPRCAFCEKIMDSGSGGICPECEKILHLAEPPERSVPPQYIDRCFAPLSYRDEVRDSLINYKFHGHVAHVETYAELISKIVYDYSLTCDIITWVPLSRKRKRSRGYDQAKLIAERLAGRIGVPCSGLLKKIRDIPAQSGTHSAEERRNNVLGVYSSSGIGVRGKRVLIVDDIITTGSTVSECAKVLRQCGALSVIAVSVAMDIK